MEIFKTRMWIEKDKKEKSPWVKVNKKVKKFEMDWWKNLTELDKGLWF